jgi:hypothetical protein
MILAIYTKQADDYAKQKLGFDSRQTCGNTIRINELEIIKVLDDMKISGLRQEKDYQVY